MYIFDDESTKKLDYITIILNKYEMQQLLGYAKQLLENPSDSDHYHLSSDDYQKEITICLLKREQFSDRIQKLIRDDV